MCFHDVILKGLKNEARPFIVNCLCRTPWTLAQQVILQ